MQAQKHLTDLEIVNIITEYKAGLSTYDLARKYDCHRNTISRNLKKRGIKVTVEKIDYAQDIKELIRLYQSVLKTEEVAKRFGISDTTVIKHLHRNGVKMRSRWDY